MLSFVSVPQSYVKGNKIYVRVCVCVCFYVERLFPVYNLVYHGSFRDLRLFPEYPDKIVSVTVVSRMIKVLATSVGYYFFSNFSVISILKVGAAVVTAKANNLRVIIYFVMDHSTMFYNVLQCFFNTHCVTIKAHPGFL